MSEPSPSMNVAVAEALEETLTHYGCCDITPGHNHPLALCGWQIPDDYECEGADGPMEDVCVVCVEVQRSDACPKGGRCRWLS